MTLPAAGSPISMSNLNTEFGGGYSLSRYYKNSTYIQSTDYSPNNVTSGAISFSKLSGAKKNTFNTQTFLTSQYWTIPFSTVGNLNVYLKGGGGGGGMYSDYWGSYGGDGGIGGTASNSVAVTSNSSYYVEVGAAGARGHYGYGYPSNPFADGTGGGGGGQSSFAGVIAGGGGGGSQGPESGYYATAGGGAYGGAAGTFGYYHEAVAASVDGYGNVISPGSAAYVDAQTYGGAGSGTGNLLIYNLLSYSIASYGLAGTGGHQTHDNTGGSALAYAGPAYADGVQGIVVITGWW